MKKKPTTTAATGDALVATQKPAPRADGKPHKKAPVKSRMPAKPARSKSRKAKATPAKTKATPKRVAKQANRDPRLPAVGSTLTRSFKGKEIKVKVLADGFEYEGEKFTSISACARHIVGYMISGPVFFHLVEPKPAAKKEA